MQESTKVTDTPSACGGVIHYVWRVTMEIVVDILAQDQNKSYRFQPAKPAKALVCSEELMEGDANDR
jgi:hypothetical protein